MEPASHCGAYGQAAMGGRLISTLSIRALVCRPNKSAAVVDQIEFDVAAAPDQLQPPLALAP